VHLITAALHDPQSSSATVRLGRFRREYRGMSAKELAEATGLAAPYISQLETGKREGTIETFKKIAAALRIDIDDIA
jgi:transcriptional regulator with XRE-family HTH domain